MNDRQGSTRSVRSNVDRWQLSARLAHSRASRWRSPDRTDNGRSALAAGTALHAPHRTLARLGM